MQLTPLAASSLTLSKQPPLYLTSELGFPLGCNIRTNALNRPISLGKHPTAWGFSGLASWSYFPSSWPSPATAHPAYRRRRGSLSKTNGLFTRGDYYEAFTTLY